ncbi:lysine N(6)-hydroxylase/L-ornithine N(5)-oxygenase family protein [Kitasatospora sp. NPDC053057]|uniref:lysine N(6)-hydroxylase/L-ornithine N(5)-oxygenase family protein n=1 Tax=Kitasatospora sp. NPDC053057 TaxID=3364062 RepID=UPI0037C7E491
MGERQRSGVVAGTGIVDVAGIGFGPSNLALAAAIAETAGEAPVSARFFEAQPRFGWHRGMLIEGATMQVSYLKDLVTMRNPTSPYSFLCYLQARGRLADFINTKSFYPLRVEFHDYLEWVAESFADLVSYGSRVVSVEPVAGEQGVEFLDVVFVAADGTRQLQRARNLVIAAGIAPRLPADLPVSPRIWHTAEFLPEVDRIASQDPRSFVVLGSGQSAAEAIEHLHARFPRAQVHSVHARYGFSVADDSPFANQVFNPEAVDRFHTAPEDVRQRLIDYHASTNYSVVDADLLHSLFQQAYLEKVAGNPRLNFHNVSRVREVTETPDGLRIDVESLSSGTSTIVEAQALVCATGYTRTDPAVFLDGLLPHCRLDDQGRLRLDREHRVVTDESVHCGIYVQGFGEHSHGLSETLLSLSAVRAGEIGDMLVKALSG